MAPRLKYKVDLTDGGFRKECARCHEMKFFEEYSKGTGTYGLQTRCKICVNEFQAENRNPASIRNNNLRNKYGFSEMEYKKMYLEQGGRCAICKRNYDKLQVDHNHTTKKVRGLLCFKCNSAIGNFDEDTVRLINAVHYLKKYNV